MSQTITLPDELYGRLAQGAADRGVTIESLLRVVSDLIVMPEKPTAQDKERARKIEKIFARFRRGQVTDKDRVELDRLIDADYQAAINRADRLIGLKHARQNGAAASPRPSKRSRK